MKGPAFPHSLPTPPFPTFPAEISFLRRAQGYTLQGGPAAWAARHGCPPPRLRGSWSSLHAAVAALPARGERRSRRRDSGSALCRISQ